MEVISAIYSEDCIERVGEEWVERVIWGVPVPNSISGEQLDWDRTRVRVWRNGFLLLLKFVKSSFCSLAVQRVVSDTG